MGTRMTTPTPQPSWRPSTSWPSLSPAGKAQLLFVLSPASFVPLYRLPPQLLSISLPSPCLVILATTTLLPRRWWWFNGVSLLSRGSRLDPCSAMGSVGSARELSLTLFVDAGKMFLWLGKFVSVQLLFFYFQCLPGHLASFVCLPVVLFFSCSRCCIDWRLYPGAFFYFLVCLIILFI